MNARSFLWSLAVLVDLFFIPRAALGAPDGWDRQEQKVKRSRRGSRNDE